MTWIQRVALRLLGVILATSACSGGAARDEVRGAPADEVRYERARVQISLDEHVQDLVVMVRPGPGPYKVCAPVLNVEARVNGVLATVRSMGGGDRDPDDGPLHCYGLEFGTPFAPGTNRIDIKFRSDDANEIADWHIAAEWNHATRVWTDDDIQAALLADKPFEVQWTPADAPAPSVDVLSLDLEGIRDVVLEELAREPGRLRYRFGGASPTGPWSVAAGYGASDEAITRCEGLRQCSVFISTTFRLTASALPPP